MSISPGGRMDPEQQLDYQRLMKAGRKIRVPESAPALKLAILADCATQQLSILLKALLGEAGLRAEIYEGAFDAIEIEACTPGSGLYEFAPDAVVIVNACQALSRNFARRTDAGTNFAEDQAAKMIGVWDAIQARCGATILQSTLAAPTESYFGNFELKVPASLRSSVSALNALVAEGARRRPGVMILDVEGIASWIGRRDFFDDRAWDMWKAPCSLAHLPRIAKCIADILLAARGRLVKCVVTDLDNTLWGGVIGDDGLEGIVLSAHDGGAGEAFVRLQRFLKELRNRGILLAVCSKNDEETALLPFARHPDMVLKRGDIAVFVANWEDKATGIRRIREELNIGLDAIVFLDDNPFERNLVRDLLPEVIVPELPEDPSLVVAYVSQLNLFEATSFSGEDAQRADLYQREAQRRESAATSASVDEYLSSLEMQMVLARFDSFHLPRISQLMQRSNQYNLCTRRLSEIDCRALMEDRRMLPLYASLTDRFGDHGLISVVVLEPEDGALAIRDWLMSCRVLSRGVEQFIMNHVVAHAAHLGLERVCGRYLPTAKNAMVRGFFQSFGFTRDADSVERWTLQVSAYQPRTTHIRPVQSTTSFADTEVPE